MRHLKHRHSHREMLDCPAMKSPRINRRLLGACFLIVALVQVILGFSILRGQLGPLGTMLYWTGCLLATLGALMCALVDALHNLRESRRERRVLLEDTLREIDEERARHAQTGGRPQKSG
jgi:hypothetical protein